MANTTYITAPVNIDGDEDDEEVNWNKGVMVRETRAITFDIGNTGQTLQGDTAFPIRLDAFGQYTGVADPGIHLWDYHYVYSDTGTRDEMLMVQEDQKAGLWPAMANISGFSLRFKQTETGSRSIWLKHVAISCVDRSGGNRIIWGSNALSKKGTAGTWYNQKWSFSSNERNAMKDHYFDRFWCYVTTEGGSIKRESGLHLGHFKLRYNVGSGYRRWVVGKYVTRPYFGNEIITGK